MNEPTHGNTAQHSSHLIAGKVRTSTTAHKGRTGTRLRVDIAPIVTARGNEIG
jgi:hypothetical protein